ncbi:MAG: RodZ domain-containing protein [Nitrospinales bacterium]
MVENFGNYLKNERELRGIPLEEIADRTKIPLRFLQALEDNNFDEIPGEVFIKGFIRSYAKSIGASAEETLAAFDESVGKQRREEAQKLENKSHLLYEKRQKFRKMVLLGFISLAVLFAGVKAYQSITETSKLESETAVSQSDTAPLATPAEPVRPPDNASPLAKPKDSKPAVPKSLPPKTQQKPTPATKPSRPEGLATLPEKAKEAVSPEPAPATQPISPEGLATPPEKAKEPAPSEPASASPAREETGVPPSPKPLALKIEVSENSWFNLIIDGTQEEDFILPVGTGKTFHGERSFKITIGNSRGAKLFLNGDLMALPESSDNVVRDFVIQAEPKG